MRLRTGRINSKQEKPDFKKLAAGDRPEEDDVIEKNLPPVSNIIMAGRKKMLEETLNIPHPEPSKYVQLPLP